MTRKQALAEMIAKVEAGEWGQSSAWKVFGIGNTGRAERAFHGSLDAAKALHEAVLPEWETTIYFDVGGAEVKLGGPRKARVKAISDNPARAWLLAILRALHSMEPDT